MIVRSITGAAREKTDTMRAKLKDQEKIRKRAFATQQLLRRQKARTRPGPRRDAEDAREAIREAVNVAAYEKEEKFAKNFSAKKARVRGGQARRRVRLLWAEFYARIGAADDGSVGSTSFKDTHAAPAQRPAGADALARSPRGTPRQPSRTLAEHRRALAEQRRAAQPPPRTGVGNMGTFAPPRTGKVSKGALIAAHRGAYNADVSPSRFGGPLDILDCRDDQGSKRERNSQLQRLRSRPFSTRFG
ncbi:3',5'-cyclic-nucleotide phosphodiesterase [Aureococcus anophagefferens]|uniref:3',5'-cyclic-nucleotide phosphodiesterase n=1 Tax=Aureococcus anophagefferens TaxID=44056 RepID=A0ABR1GFZ5_AURAN